jgi:molybdate transport system ATP-binding protein
MLRAAVDLTVGAFHLDVAVAVGEGELVAVLGPNGAGKTTLLRAVAGLLAIDGGRIALGDRVLDDPVAGVFVEPEDRPIGVVFQEHRLFPHLSALDNVAFGLRRRGMRRRAARAAADEWLARVGLAAEGGRRPAQLSGGQAQRVALARALALDPALLLLDEPLASLDVHTRAEVRRDLRRHLEEFGGMRLLVTHDPIDALTLAHRLVIVEGGRVVQEGTPEEVTERPRTDYVAELVGTNLYRGTADGQQVRTDSGAVIVAPAAASAAPGPAYAVISPAAVAIHRRPPDGSPRNVWPGKVTHIERLATRARVRVDGPVAIVADVTVAAVAALDLREGSDVWVAVKASEVGVYPA